MIWLMPKFISTAYFTASVLSEYYLRAKELRPARRACEQGVEAGSLNGPVAVGNALRVHVKSLRGYRVQEQVKICLILLAVTLVTLARDAQGVTDFTDRFIRQRGVIQPLDSSPFGEKIGLYLGSVEFVQTDIDLPGNNSLPVSLGRRFVPFSGVYRDGSFVDWELDIPNIHGIFPAKYGWVVSYGGPSVKRCSKYGPPMDGDVSDGSLSRSETFWNGTQVYLPGAGEQELLRKDPSTLGPLDGNSYVLTTVDGSALRCTGSLAGGSEGGGEGFVMVRPDGTKIQFDYMVSRYVLSQENSSGAILRLKEYRMLPTSISDRFGNTVTYIWSGKRLVSIAASDGRRIDVVGNPITSATDGVRKWTYDYTNNGSQQGGRLRRVILPDGSAWQFSLDGIYFGNPPVYASIDCDEDGPNLRLAGVRVGTITHPNGVAGEFTITATAHGRSWVPQRCVGSTIASASPPTSYAYQPRIFGSWSITRRKLTGPGLPVEGHIWTYMYGPTNHCWEVAIKRGARICDVNFPTTKRVDVAQPGGVVTRYTFGNRFEVNEGKLLRIDEGWGGTAALRTTVNTYALPDAGPYPSYIGGSPQPRGDGTIGTRYTPLRTRIVTQQGYMYKWQVASDCAGIPFCFDTRARPLKIIESSAISP